MELLIAIREADALLPGPPVEQGPAARWLASIRVGEFIESVSDPIRAFARRWGSDSQEDLRNAIATCLLEHLLERHFDTYFPQVEARALTSPLCGDTFQGCWSFGPSDEPTNAKRLATLKAPGPISQLQ